MSIAIICLSAVVVALAGYLFYALIYPDKF